MYFSTIALFIPVWYTMQKNRDKKGGGCVDLSNFKVFDFSEGVPYVSVTNNGLTFNKSVVIKLNYPEYVRLLINESDKQIAIQVCDGSEEKAVQFYKQKPNGVLSVRWNAKDLINTLSRICDWNLKQSSYRVNGILVPENSLMLFELEDAIALV